MKKAKIIFLLFLFPLWLVAQERVINGKVTDEFGEGIPGVTVIVKESQIGTITQMDGSYKIKIPTSASTLVYSFVGMLTQEVKISGNSIDVTLRTDNVGLEEVVVVGYGTQRKESVVGAITSIKGEALMQSGGVPSVGEALDGKIPGLVTLYTSGQPGENDIQIFLRGRSSWNGTGSPLILVDGIERDMNDLDMNEVSDISVLKDASATAVYGVKGANGVVLLTTKRGQKGKAKLSFSGNITGMAISKVPGKYDSYDALMVTNESAMRELPYNELSWADITPVQVADKYRNQTTQLQREMYPNVDWQDYMLKDFGTSSRLNASIRGGSDFATYFVNLSYLNEGDMVKDFDNDKGYTSEASYQRFSYRSNLDFKLTKTTKLAVNLSGTYGIQKYPTFGANAWKLHSFLYKMPPDLFYPRYSDGAYGFYSSDFENSLFMYKSNGYSKNYSFKLNTDFTLKQDLGFITKGLSFTGAFSLDNSMSGSQKLSDSDNVIFKRYYNDGQDIQYDIPATGNDYEYVIEPWTINSFSVGGESRRIDYRLSLNYNRTFAKKHKTSALFLFKRQKYGAGNMFPIYYEDWVGRVTYDYNSTYFFEANGAYNGSEKFGPGYRFQLFPSLALGWLVSNENFIKDLDWIDKIKIRGSIGEVGDDSFSGRWLYLTQWAAAGNKPGLMVPDKNSNKQSPYQPYREDVLGNENVRWETALKKDIGLELSFLKGSITSEIDYFEENRMDIYIDGDDRTIPDWVGATPPGANLGKVDVKGYEISLGLKHSFSKDLRVWSDMSATYAKDEIIYKDDPAYMPAYQKQEGYSIGQTRAGIPIEIMQNWDDIYMSTPLVSGDSYKRVGYYDMVDFNGDGDYNGTFDIVPYGYPTRPQKTWSWTVGSQYKGFSVSAQFYGQTNSIRDYQLFLFTLQTHLYYTAYEDYWSKENPTGQNTLQPWLINQASSDPLSSLIDGSTVRLKMVELSYRLPTASCKRIGVNGVRFYLNGNNLIFWSKMADDRGFNLGNSSSRGAYPTVKRFNFGFNIDL